VSPLASNHLSATWSVLDLESYRLVRKRRQDGLRSMSPIAGRRNGIQECQMDAYFPMAPFISPFVSFISPFISLCWVFISPFISLCWAFMLLFISP